MNKRILLIVGFVVAIVVAVGIFWYIRQRGYRFEQDTGVGPPPGPQIIEEEKDTPTAYEIVGYTTSSAGTEIFTISPFDAKRRIVFTDRDENLKIKTLRSTFGDGRRVLAHLAKKNEHTPTVLGVLTIEGAAGITTLLENFGATEAPVPSPDGKKVAYIVFSNADPDVGYSVMVMNNDGSNKRRLIRRDALITSLAFAPDGTKLAFVADTGSGMAIQTVNIDGSTEAVMIAEYTNEIVYDLRWGNNLVFGKRPRAETDANKGELYSLSETGSGLRRLTTNDSFDGSPIILPDGTTLALLRTTFSSGKYSTAGEMTLMTIAMDDNRETELGSADGILGWRTAAAVMQSP